MRARARRGCAGQGGARRAREEVLDCHEAAEVWEGDRGLCEEGVIGGGEDECGEAASGVCEEGRGDG